ncbi:dTMP kinase [Streptomyces caatingaensis]|uniref:Thymidylate kinase n=1 Tax=Streptomyces caatingaensis TaxID=1678637 RepID=A0A0K9XHF9_9ACTN|nr:dTMP kinase [Streptomyces caatingaensis]KNB52117.1 thymidylate kinase [Streptomyces caatingaensis]
MTRAEHPTPVTSPSGALAADSRERAVRALLRIPSLKRLWSAQAAGGVGDALGVLVLVLLAFQAAVAAGSFGGGYRGAALAVAAVIGARLLATALLGAALLGPLSSVLAPAGPLDRRWTMVGADAVRAVLLAVAPVWIDFTERNSLVLLLVTAFLLGAAERVWGVAKDGVAPSLLPGAPPEPDPVRPGPDHRDALRRLSLRTSFVALPVAAAALIAITLVSNLLGSGIDWFHLHQAALGSYLAAALFNASGVIVHFLPLPGAQAPVPRSPLEGLRRPKGAQGPDKGRTGGIPVFVLACAAVAGAIAAAVGVAVLQAYDLGGGPVAFGLLVLALTGGPVAGIRAAARILPGFSRRRLLALGLGVTGLALLVAGLVPDPTTGLLLVLLAGVSAGVVANTGHTLLDQETEEGARERTTAHLHAVVRVTVALGAVVAPVLAALIGPHRAESGSFVFAHGGAAFTLMLIGALLLPVGALVLGRTDDRHGVPFHRDLLDAVRDGDPAQAPARSGFFIAFEGGDGAGKSTQVQAIAEWIRAKGHEVVVTREPGATPIGKRLRAILLDVASAGLSDRAEALLYAADRAEHVNAVVRPALERGAVVISDRYIDSSVAYQGAGRDLSPTEIARINRWATEGLVPHLTVLLDVSPETARERFTEAPDRLESEPAEFHQRVRSGFLALAAADPARYLVVDAGQEPDEVTTVVRHRLDQDLPLSAAEEKALAEARRAAEEEARRRAEEEAARKAEEERLERERREQLARLRAEEEERKRREAEEAARREAERQAEEARVRAEETRRLAEEERRRREAEERVRAEEQERLREQAAEEARLRAEAEERRREKQRAAEEALLAAEAARTAAEAAREAGEAGETGVAAEAAAPDLSERGPLSERRSLSGSGSLSERGSAGSDRSGPGAGPGTQPSRGTPDEVPTVEQASVRGEAERTERLQAPSVHRPDPRETVRMRDADETLTVESPMVHRADPHEADAARGRDDSGDTTAVLPLGSADETEVLPPVTDGGRGEDATAVLPPVPPVPPVSPGKPAKPTKPAKSTKPARPAAPSAGSAPQRVTWGVGEGGAGSGGTGGAAGAKPAPARREDPVDRVPDWLFRPEDQDQEQEKQRPAPSPKAPADEADNVRTREMPRPGDGSEGTAAPGPRKPWRRPEWAEDATLADELLGPRDDDGGDTGGGKGPRRRGK